MIIFPANPEIALADYFDGGIKCWRIINGRIE